MPRLLQRSHYAEAFRDDVLETCNGAKTDVFVATSSSTFIDLFKALCPANRILHMPLDHKGVAGFSGNQFDLTDKRKSKLDGVHDTMAEWILLSRASAITVFCGPSSFSGEEGLSSRLIDST